MGKLTTEQVDTIITINTLLETASMGVEEAATHVNELVKSGVKVGSIVEHSGYLTRHDINSLIQIANNKLSPRLWLISCPGSSILRKAPVETQNRVIDDGVLVWNPSRNETEVIPVGKLTKVLAIQALDAKGNIRNVVQQKRFLSTWQPPAKKPLYQFANGKIVFNRSCSFSPTELRKLINTVK